MNPPTLYNHNPPTNHISITKPKPTPEIYLPSTMSEQATTPPYLNSVE